MTMAAKKVSINGRLLQPVPPDIVEVCLPGVTEPIVYCHDLARLVEKLACEFIHPDSYPKALLFGGPGLGKTATLRNFAVQSKRPFWWVRYERLFTSFLGGTASNLAGLFHSAREAGAVIVFDDLDAVARKRDDPRESGESRRVVAALLSALDDPRDGVAVLGATNLPEAIDPAAFRRFENLLPFRALGREEMLNLLAKLLPSEKVPMQLVNLARRASPAELVDILRHGPSTGSRVPYLRAALTQRIKALSLIRKRP